MNTERLSEILDGLGISRRDMGQRVPGMERDGKIVRLWRSGKAVVPEWTAAWLEELWAARDDEAKLRVVWARPPHMRTGAVNDTPEPPMSAQELDEVMDELHFSNRDILRVVSWLDTDEVGSWLRGEEEVQPSVARWLRQLLNAARTGDSDAYEAIHRHRPPPPLPGQVRYDQGAGRIRRPVSEHQGPQDEEE